MGNVFEFKLQSPSGKTVDIDKTKAEISKDFADFKKKVEETMATVKSKIVNSTTLADAKKFLEDVPLYADAGSLTLTISNTSLKAKDQAEYDEQVNSINASLAQAKAEVDAYFAKLQEQQKQVAAETHQETTDLKNALGTAEVHADAATGTTDVTGEKTESKTEVKEEISPYPSFKDLTLLQKAYADHPEFAKVVEPTREEKRITRLGERIQNARSDRRREKLSAKQRKAAEDLTQSRIETAMNTKAVAANSIVSEELEHQTRYFIDIQQALATAQETNRVHYFDEHILIDTYHPLFTGAANLKGTIRLERPKRTKEEKELEKTLKNDIDQKKADEYYRYFPEDKAKYADKGGLIGSLVDGMVAHTNFPPQSAPALKSAAKIGVLIGMGVLGRKAIKKIFNIGGKNKEGEGRKWGLGTAAVLLGVPMLTGQGVFKLLTSGDSKDAWEKVKELGSKTGLDIKSFFSPTDTEVVYPALGNRLFGTMTLEEFSRFTTVQDGNYKLRTEEYKQYLTEKAASTTTTIEQTEYVNRIALLDVMIKQKSTDSITDAYAKAIKVDTADKSKTGAELYKAYLDGQLLTANILDQDKKLKVKDPVALNDYLVKEIVGKEREPKSITKDELKRAGFFTEVVVVAGTGAATVGGAAGTEKPSTTETPSSTTTTTTTETTTSKSKKESSKDNEKSNLEKAGERTKEKWEALKKGVSDSATKIQKFFTTLFSGGNSEKKPDSKKPDSKNTDSKAVADLKKQVATEKARLKDLNKQLDQLEKLDAVTRDEIVTEKEIGEIRVLLEEDQIKLKKIEALIASGPLDREFTEGGLTWLTEAQQLDLSRALKKINFELKFNTPNDEARFQTYNPLRQWDKTRLFLESCSGMTNIRMENGKYYLDTLMVPFDDAESVVRMANLTNFLKINFSNRATTNVDKPWFIANDGDLTFESQTSWDAAKKWDFKWVLFNTTALDGSDGLKSAIKEMGGDVFESRKADYAQYLCGLKNERNESIWTKKAQNGMIPEELKSMETKFGPLLKIVQKKGNLPEAETPEGYTGSDEVTDPNSSLDTQEGYLILRNHGHKISIVPSEEEPWKYQIGSVNGKSKDGKLMGEYLNLNFTAEEALKTATLVNFINKAFVGNGASNWYHPGTHNWNLGTFTDDLEFTVKGMHFDATLMTKKQMQKFASIFASAGNIQIFADWLNSMKKWA